MAEKVVGSGSRVPWIPSTGVSDVLPQLDSIQVVYCQSWPHDDPSGRLAAELGGSPKHRLYSGIGGTTPQDLVNRTSLAMQRGDIGLALICSAEALATVSAAKRRGERLPWSRRKSSPFPWEPPHEAELAHEVVQAWETFPLWDTAWSGPGTLCAYTVAHGRDGSPSQGLVVLDTIEVGRSPGCASGTCSWMPNHGELVGAEVTVTTDGRRNEARW